MVSVKPHESTQWPAKKIAGRESPGQDYLIWQFQDKATQYLPRTWHSPTFRQNGGFGVLVSEIQSFGARGARVVGRSTSRTVWVSRLDSFLQRVALFLTIHRTQK